MIRPERVLIADADVIHAEELQQVLESIGYRVAICARETSAAAIIKSDCPDLVIIVPHSSGTFGDAIALARSAAQHLHQLPEFLFVLRWTPRGPAERLMGDRWNVQVLYER